MFKRHFSLLAIATLLLSPTVAHADLIDGDGNVSVGNVRIQTTNRGTIIQTPKIQVNTPKSTDNRLSVNRTRRRSRIPARARTSSPMILNKKVSTDSSTTVIKTTTPVSIPTISTPTIRNSTIQNSTIRSSGDDGYPTPTTRSSTVRSSSGDSESVNEQHQSIQCSGGGSSVSQSSTTINGRTVNSEVRSNCN
jgi:hypothetical protein